MKRLLDKVVIIVGATSGIGEATARLFASEGAKVIFTGRRAENGQRIEKEIKAKGLTADFIQCDSLKSTELKNVVDKTIEKYGRIDILHNNAGISISAPFLEIDLKNNFDKSMDMNARSYVEMIQLVLPHMQKAKKGSIINTSSVGVKLPVADLIPYSMSKIAVSHMTRALAASLGEYNIRVNAICPGNTLTEMVEAGGVFESNILPQIPLKRSADPKEIANGALFLASDESSYVTGIELFIDGGLSL